MTDTAQLLAAIAADVDRFSGPLERFHNAAEELDLLLEETRTSLAAIRNVLDDAP